MITSPAFKGKKYAVLGLARSGRATVDALLASGAEVVAWDEKEEARNQFLPCEAGEGDHAQHGGGAERSEVAESAAAPRRPSTTGFAGGPPPPDKLGEDLTLADPLALDLTGFDGVVVSPGVPLNRHPIAAHAAKHGVPVIGDIELFAQARGGLPPHKVVGITGTNGKSTTTALIHHILRTAGVPATMGGNIGLPILAQDPLPAGGVYVLELSSYQIDLTQSLDCDVAVLLNITPDHLDRYESFEKYVASKRRLFEMQSSDSFGIFIEEDEQVWRLFDDLEMGGWSYSGHAWQVLSSQFDDDHVPRTLLGVNEGRGGAVLLHQAEWPALQGPHNGQNVVAAIAVADALGLSDKAIHQALRTYPGLPHRMERVAEKRGVVFVNDSKATNPTSTAPALAAYPAIRWILGGLAKTRDLDACAPHFGHVRSAYTIGEAGPGYAQILSAHMPVTECGVLEEAVRRAADDAEAGDVVLLSPACASFDQFRDYEARGQAFRAAVGAL